MKFLNKLLIVLCLALACVGVAIFVTKGKTSDREGSGGSSGGANEYSTISSSSPEIRTPEVSEEPNQSTVATTSPAENRQEYTSSGTQQSEQIVTPSEEWSHPKEWYCNVCNSIRKNVRVYLEGPYSCDRSLANRLLTMASSIEQNINSWSPSTVENQCRRLGQDYKQFQDGCAWRSGVRHPKFAHVISAAQQNSWCAENGWEFVRPGTSDLTVRKAKVAHRCNTCRGSGQVIVRNRCPNCGGRGKVDNPAAFAAQAAVDIAGMFGKKGRRRSIPTGPRTIPCSNCQGRGQIQVASPCGTCGGSGQILR